MDGEEGQFGGVRIPGVVRMESAGKEGDALLYTGHGFPIHVWHLSALLKVSSELSRDAETPVPIAPVIVALPVILW
ncbi:MAG: hypothetical protein LUQ50_06400 [Methanospirillum sp.]|uniref:hypothetical protein n=1 Tax=Methanospirillum sp. TaxID=45200 RepID=UPI00237276A0|nr:hypothetical protein [Methanospirillum sp.]MDD1728684.1 hypothetical protein [Methanospirillum sp.]